MAVLSFKATSPYYVPGLADFSQSSFWIAAAMIIFNPLFWNTVAQNEYRNKTITKLLGNRPLYGCYLLGATIFLLGIIRDHFYNQALAKQPTNGLLVLPIVKYFGALLFLAGQTFVLSSMYALGFTGTYLGDYFGILMDGIVTGFPFNVIPDPMYWGSSLCFVGVALWFGKPAGLLLSTLVVIVYAIALRFEGPFTANIYAQAANKKKKSSASSRRNSTSASSTTATAAKRSASTSRRNSTAASKKNGDGETATPKSTRKPRQSNAAGAGTPARKRKDSTASTKSTKAAAKSASEGTPATTPAKRGRKKKVIADA